MEIYIKIPELCPFCNEKTIIKTSSNGIKTLWCSNENCNSKLINKLDHFCGKKGLDIKGLSKATLEKLIDWEWIKSYADLFKLHEYKSEWIKLPGFGEKSVTKILEAIEEGRNCNLDKFIAALGIPLIGTRAAQDLDRQFTSWTNFISAIKTNFKFYDMPNFGWEMHSSLINFDYTEAMDLADNYVNILTSEYGIEETAATLDGKTFVITGKLSLHKNRDEIKSVIERHGGKVTGSISSKTNYLINNDVNSTSSKNVSAKKLGVPIISEETFIEMFGI